MTPNCMSTARLRSPRAAFWCRVALRLSGCRTAVLVCSIHGFATPFYAWPRRLLQSGVMKWVGSGAGAVIAEATAALNLEATAESLFHAIHAHPTLSEAMGEAARAVHERAIHF